MAYLTRDSSTGQFVPKGDEARAIRSLRLSDSCWDNLLEVATAKGISRSDFLEQLNDSGNFEAVEQDITLDTITDLLSEFLEDLYDPDGNEYEVPARDKAAIKRFVPIFIQFLSDNL